MTYVKEEIEQSVVNFICPSCSLTTGHPEVEITDEEIESDGETLTATVTYEVTCAHCGEVEEQTYRV